MFSCDVSSHLWISQLKYMFHYLDYFFNFWAFNLEIILNLFFKLIEIIHSTVIYLELKEFHWNL